MSPRFWKERVIDILNAISEIHAFVDGMDYTNFQTDLKTIRAVELNFIILGEAANSIPDEIQEAYPEISWKLMRGIRNRLVHTYFSVSPKILWDTIEQDLPDLEIDLKKIINDGN
jgi:uncharacterized protein with HEPN domain